MKNRHYPVRYAAFLLGLFLTALGVALMTKAALGNSPVSAIPCSLSYILPRFTIGFWSAMQNVLFVLIQVVVERKKVNKAEIALQLAVSFVFGAVVDFCMLLISGLRLQIYVMKLIAFVFGCGFIAIGSWWEIMGDVVMLPGDSLVRMFVRLTGKEYGKVKMCIDGTLTLIALALSLVFLHELKGVREGTFMAVFLTGNLIRLFTRLLRNTALCHYYENLR